MSFFENTSLLGSFFALSISGLCSSNTHMKTHIVHTARAQALYSCNKVPLLNFELGMDIHQANTTQGIGSKDVSLLWIPQLYSPPWIEKGVDPGCQTGCKWGVTKIYEKMSLH